MHIISINNYQNNKKLQVSYKQSLYKYPKIKIEHNLPKNNIKKNNPIKKWLRGAFLMGGLMYLVNSCHNNWNDFLKTKGFVEPEKTEFRNTNDAISYAIDRITPYLNSETPKEYSVIIGTRKNKIVSERLGDSVSVSNYTYGYLLMDIMNIPHPHIDLHGHPEDVYKNEKRATQTFSFQDFLSLNNNKNCIGSIVVNKNGQICALLKKEDFKQLSGEEIKELRKEHTVALNSSWPNIINVTKDNEIIHQFYDYQGLHEFWNRVADKYNLEYFTTYGVFNGIDVYEESYYPEFKSTKQ